MSRTSKPLSVVAVVGPSFPDALVRSQLDTPVLLAAGGSERHSLILELAPRAGGGEA